MAADYKTLLGLVREFLSEAETLPEFNIGQEDLLSRARAAVASTPKPESAILHSWITVADDECCSRRLASAGRAGKLDEFAEWTCGKCGTRFFPTDRMSEGGHLRVWQPVNIIEVLFLGKT